MEIEGTDSQGYLFDFAPFSDTTQLAITDIKTQRYMLFDGAGIHFGDASCNYVMDFDIAFFGAFLQSIAIENGLIGMKRRALTKRASESSFSVTLALTDQCQKKVTDLQPVLSLGSMPCVLGSSTLPGSFTWTCQFPGASSNISLCEDSIDAWFTDGLPGFDANTPWTVVAQVVSGILGNYLTAAWFQRIATVLGVIITPNIAAAMDVFGTLGTVGLEAMASLDRLYAEYNSESPNGLSSDICARFWDSSVLPIPLKLVAGSTTKVITTVSSAPVVSITQAVTVVDPSDKSC